MSFPEDILLLALDDDTGHLRPMPPQAFVSAMAGAMLFDLAFCNRLDNDVLEVFLVEQPGTIPAHLEKLHDTLAMQADRITIAHALAIAALCVPDCLQQIYDQLVEQKILTRSGRFSTTQPNTYTKSDWSRVIALRQRIRTTVMTHTTPDPNDVVILSLMHGCELDNLLFNTTEREQYQLRIGQLTRMEILAQQLLKAIQEAKKTSYEETAATLVGKDLSPGMAAGGVSAVMTAMGSVYKALGVRRGTLALSRINQARGFDCSSCAWPEPDSGCSRFEFCENGAKALASEATYKIIEPSFFKQWSIHDLAAQSGYWMEKQGRLAHPMILREGATHYEPFTYQEAYDVIKEKMAALPSADNAIFYVCGHASNESTFLFQLLARQFGTNNLPNSINLCHEPSGTGMKQSLGYGKGDATLDDIENTAAIFLFGHNPGSNHPRMLKSLQIAARKGARIVSINPLPEAGLSGFANPQEVSGLLGHVTPLTDLHVPIRINGDLAFVHGLIKCMLQAETLNPGSIFDVDFITQRTSGVEPLLESVRQTTWETIETTSGVSQAMIEHAAEIYMTAESVVCTWGLGITQHCNGTETIQHIINMMLLRGNIGRPGTGLCPMRGHSNILGIRSMGGGENMGNAFLDALEKQCNFKVPHNPGLDAVNAIRSMQKGHAKVCISLGGNLAASSPDTEYTQAALRKCDLTVMISTKLNQSHTVTGRTAIILPCLGRSEIDKQGGIPQYVTVEDAMGYVHASQGCLKPVAPEVQSESRIVAEMAQTVLGNTSTIPWKNLANDYGQIRALIECVVASYTGFTQQTNHQKRFEIYNPLREGIFMTPDERAHFTNLQPKSIQMNQTSSMFQLMSIRSHDQFNTTIYGLDDRYRGIRNQRRVVLLNHEDMQQLRIAPEQAVTITSHHEDETRSAPAFHAIPYSIPRHCAAVYFPEANMLVPHSKLDTKTATPASKSIAVTIAPI